MGYGNISIFSERLPIILYLCTNIYHNIYEYENDLKENDGCCRNDDSNAVSPCIRG